MSAQAFPSSRKRIIFANIVSEQMFDDPPLDYAERMCAVTPRKMWWGRPGDLIVTPVAISSYFRRYVEDVRRLDLSTVECLTPAGDPRRALAERVASDPSVLERVKAYVAANPGVPLAAFCADYPTVGLVRQLGIALEGYAPVPSEATLEACYRVNTKSGFHDVATSLGLRTVEGRCCERDSLLAAVREIGATWPAVHVKSDRSTNGYGHAVLSSSDGSDLGKQVSLLTDSPSAPDAFIVERHLDFVALPSVEIQLTDAGVDIPYVCDMRCPNNAWTGMMTPPDSLAPAVIAELLEMGRRFGKWAWDVGYRGICDLDCGVTPDGLVWVNESNFRRTGGTYLHNLVQSLVGPDYLRTHVWIADVRPGGLADFAAGREAVRTAGLDFDHATQEGVVLTADTRSFDSKWRYLIIARSHEATRELERRLTDALRLPGDVGPSAAGVVKPAPQEAAQ
jgi:hypothetical protein